MFLMQMSKTAKPMEQVKSALLELQDALERLKVPATNAEYDVKNGAGKVKETPETAKARAAINSYAAKLDPADKKVFTANLGGTYWLMGEPTVRNAIVKDPQVLDKVLMLNNILMTVESPEEKTSKIVGFFKK